MTPRMPNETIPDDSDDENVPPHYNEPGEIGDQDEEDEDTGWDEDPDTSDFDEDDEPVHQSVSDRVGRRWEAQMGFNDSGGQFPFGT